MDALDAKRESWHLRPMNVFGIDFTSRPSKRKAITCLACQLYGTHLVAESLSEWQDFESFEAALAKPGPWITGADFPFGFARRFVENIGWPLSWSGTIETVMRMDRKAFRDALDDYRSDRAPGDKEHRRLTDIAAGAISPQKLYGTPVGLMLFEGAPRLLDANVTIPGLRAGDPQRVIVEAYPALLARNLIGRRSYKQDAKSKQTADQHDARIDLLRIIKQGALQQRYGITVDAPDWLANEPGADHIDTLLCAIQAAWSWTQRDHGYGQPDGLDSLEGWIADPTLRLPRTAD